MITNYRLKLQCRCTFEAPSNSKPKGGKVEEKIPLTTKQSSATVRWLVVQLLLSRSHFCFFHIFWNKKAKPVPFHSIVLRHLFDSELFFFMSFIESWIRIKIIILCPPYIWTFVKDCKTFSSFYSLLNLSAPSSENTC